MNGQSWFDSILAFVTGGGIAALAAWLVAHAAQLKSAAAKADQVLKDHGALSSRVDQLEALATVQASKTAPGAAIAAPGAPAQS